MTVTRSTILVLHPSSTDPTSFLQPSSTSTSTNHAETSDMGASTSYSSANVPWDIDNKYYTASVTFEAYPQEIYEASKAEGIDVVIYLFEGSIHSLPAGLVKVMAVPRDIGLAIRLRSTPDAGVTQTQEGSEESESEKMEDLFDEIGMEYMDESSLPEEDDERPISIEERIRQTLMTHMWPNMVRKPIKSRMDMGFEDDDEDYDDTAEGVVVGETETDFPVTFNPLHSQPPTNDLSESANLDDFPGVDEIRSQIMLEDLDNLDLRGRDELSVRLNMMDVFDDFEDDNPNNIDWMGAEYARLDDWLDEDGDQIPDQNQMERPNEEYDEEEERAQLQQLEDELAEPTPKIEESQFEDDFADFAPFQSAPAPLPSGFTGAASLDPTPLLLHLQNVREELAGLDEDTRRERAGREVESVLQSLGLGSLGGVEWEDDLGDDI